jgi:hypothetical protein
LCRGSHRQALIAPGVFIAETPPDEIYNLPLILAYAVLDQVLNELMCQGSFSPPVNKKGATIRIPALGVKMAASKAGLQWMDYDLVAEGKNARNQLAHEAMLLSRAD